MDDKSRAHGTPVTTDCSGRPAYQPPRALRMRDQQIGAGVCVFGNGGVGNCWVGGDATMNCYVLGSGASRTCTTGSNGHNS